MTEIFFRSDCLWLSTEAAPRQMSASDIYALAFEGATNLYQIPVSREDLLATGLEFTRFPAAPVALIEASYKDNQLSIECNLVAIAKDFEARIQKNQNVFLDYAVSKKRWVPLPLDTSKVATDFLKVAGLGEFGPISVNDYLSIIGLANSPLIVEDRTDQLLSADHISSSVSGLLPLKFNGKLYPYQENGFRWLSWMRKNGIGCIIADEMGLGKTIQVICLLLEVAETERCPSLVIAPATLLENWRRELDLFAPGLKVLIHRGSSRTGFPDELRAYHIILTSFETAVADISLLRNIKWEVLVIDEAQGIKNPTAKRSIKLKTLNRRHAVAMTGTPVENRLSDIWSITDFVVPSLLKTIDVFESNHPDTIEGASALEPVLKPIILRRRVREVADDLPERIDIPQPLELDDESAMEYEAIRSSSGNNGANLAALVKLRMFCSHPWLVDQCTDIAQPADCSIKLTRLLEILEELIAVGEKALIFTSWQKSADLLSREIIANFHIPVWVIDGRTDIDSRQTIIDRFSIEPHSAILVLNPKAAGVGLNITAANHVIHYNLEWNPAIEDQASARAWRRGQKQVVRIYRLFYINTVEEIINERMTRKRLLAETAITGTDGTDYDMHDILKALQISPVSRR